MAVRVAAGIWLLHLVTVTGLQIASTVQPSLLSAADHAEHVGLQALAVSVSFLLLCVSGVTRPAVYLLLVAQALLGLAVLHWPLGLPAENLARFSLSSLDFAWAIGNLLVISLVTLAVGRQVQKTHSTASWLALSACLLGLGLCVDQLVLGSDGQRVGLLVHLMYALLLLVTWRMSARAETRGSHNRAVSAFAADFSHSANMDLMSDYGPSPDAAAMAVSYERRRIGQDLHDGVASQLVNILSSLDVKTPQQHAIALAIEQCLLDLKLTVDGLDSVNDSVLDALGRLRYRVQHSLEKLGIRLSWRVEMRDELEAVRGETAQHALRIAQEALANVMLHARASAVEVVCRFVPESALMVIEVRDNGRGISPRKDDRRLEMGARRSGKGLTGMRHRAKTLGGELSVSSKPGAGTRVRLTLSLASLLERSQKSDNFKHTGSLAHGLDGVATTR
jgi:signal transduction histidine kinase